MIRHLLEHTSGILREGPAFNPNVRQPDIDVIRSAYSARLEFDPGTRFQYCNVCYFALAEVIARVSGKPWEVFMRERVFAPVGMIATATTADSIPNVRAPTGMTTPITWRPTGQRCGRVARSCLPFSISPAGIPCSTREQS